MVAVVDPCGASVVGAIASWTRCWFAVTVGGGRALVGSVLRLKRLSVWWVFLAQGLLCAGNRHKRSGRCRFLFLWVGAGLWCDAWWGWGIRFAVAEKPVGEKIHGSDLVDDDTINRDR